MHHIDHKLKIKSEDLIWHVHEYDLDPTSSHIYLFGSEVYQGGVGTEEGAAEEPGVDYLMANRFIRNLNLCMRANQNKPILIHMKTCGGDWQEGMAIYNAIKACPVPVTILNYTHARSMSSLIFLSANKRVMMPDSYFMFHDGTIGYSGTVKQVNSSHEFAKASDQRMLNIYADTMKEQGKFKDWSRDRIIKMLRTQMDKKEDVFLTTEQTVEWGFADAIFGTGELGYDWSKLTEYTDEQLKR
jgi:ATP-dependent protease ClpP protease subunit